MKKITTILAPMLAIALVLPTASALAEKGSDDVSVDATVSVETRGNGDDHAETKASTTIKNDDDSSKETDTKGDDDSWRASSTKGDDDNDDDNATSSKRENSHASTTENEHGKVTSEIHRSAVAAFVESLLAVADRDSGIGEQVREVAHHQNDTASSTTDAMVKVEHRSRVVEFLFGTDWKSLGALHTAITDTQKDIDQLKTLLIKTTDASVRADLEAQITVLENQKVQMQAFVDEHENSFSLFGWFTKFFAGSDK